VRAGGGQAILDQGGVCKTHRRLARKPENLWDGLANGGLKRKGGCPKVQQSHLEIPRQ